MQPFQNILAGVDLAACPGFDVASLRASPRAAIRQAIHLARLSGGRLLFFAALDMTEEALHYLEEEHRTHVRHTVEELARNALDELVRQSRAEGVAAEAQLALGTGWREIVKQVEVGEHDLVVVGTRDVSGLRRMLFGSTAQKLLRRCPCPVLVTRPEAGAHPPRFLVATDLQPAGLAALRLGLAMGRLHGVAIDVLHAVDYPLDYLGGALPDAAADAYHHKVRAEARDALQRQLNDADATEGDINVHIFDAVGGPDLAIRQFIEHHGIDVLVLGTLARSGVDRFLIGNTAERLLPEVHCSVLAVKPPGFAMPR